jgi:cell division protein FtsN
MGLGVLGADHFFASKLSPEVKAPKPSKVELVPQVVPGQSSSATESENPVSVTEVPAGVGSSRRANVLKQFVGDRSRRETTSPKRRHSVTPKVTETAPPEPEPAAEPVADPEQSASYPPGDRTGPAYSVQAGAFEEEGNARKLADDLASSGYAASISTRKSTKGKTLYKVVVGSFDRQEDADKKAGELKDKGFTSSVNQE